MNERITEAMFVRRVLIVLAIGVAALAAWRLRRVELLLFGAILAGVLFDALAQILQRRLHLPRGWALASGVLGVVLVVVVAIAFFGFRFEAQLAELIAGLPPAWSHLRQSLGSTPLGAELLKAIDQLGGAPGGQMLSHLKDYALSAGVAVMGAVLIGVAGLYLAAQPNAYRRGALHLLAPKDRPQVEAFLSDCGRMLRRWLLAQATAMATIGVATGISFWIIGVPAAGALAVLAAIGEFIPMVGVIIASAPALVLAATHGWTPVAWTLAVLVVIHQLDGNLLQPLLQRGMVQVPPVLSLFAIVGFGAFFGPLGVLFAAPLTIVCIAAVRTWRKDP
jgi:predicted PurR-regulated permease PerM